MKSKIPFYSVLIFSCYIFSIHFLCGCAQMGAPTGGPKDTIPPHLVNANPAMFDTGFTGNKVVFNFDEYVNVENIQSELMVSPYQKANPTVNFKLKTVTVKFKDTLKPNTTYSLNFGKAIKDVNEGNVLKNFTYVFSTGNTIDSLTFSGNVLLAETGKVDSTLQVYLYKNANDSSVEQKRPDYIARLKLWCHRSCHHCLGSSWRGHRRKRIDATR